MKGEDRGNAALQVQTILAGLRDTAGVVERARLQKIPN